MVLQHRRLSVQVIHCDYRRLGPWRYPLMMIIFITDRDEEAERRKKRRKNKIAILLEHFTRNGSDAKLIENEATAPSSALPIYRDADTYIASPRARCSSILFFIIMISYLQPTMDPKLPFSRLLTIFPGRTYSNCDSAPFTRSVRVWAQIFRCRHKM